MLPVHPPAPAGLELSGPDLDALLRAALAEDLGPGDVTSEAALEEAAVARGELVAKAEGVLAGAAVFARVFTLLDPDCEVELVVPDAGGVRPGLVVARLRGSARALLAGERTALNLVQRLSGIATLTARFVAAAGGSARILDTRKTTPGLRRLEKHAVRCGGGDNHRFGLFDEAMVKDNHTDLSPKPLAEIVRAIRARRGAAFRVTVEARDGPEAFAAVAAGADVVLLDNMSPSAMSSLVPRLRAAASERGILIEASGNVSLDTVAAIAASGVDRISVGALTHSAPALDLSLRLVPGGEA